MRKLASVLLAVATVIVAPATSHAWVNITYPGNDSLISGTLTIQASITQDWWSQLRIDGKPVASTSSGTITFRWDSTTVKDGAHSLVILGYPQGAQAADSSQTLAISVMNHPSGGTPLYFGTLPATSPLPTGSWCAQAIPPETEMVPANVTANHTMPTSVELAAYAANGYTANYYNGQWAYARADGQYTGTTDMIIRWAACKWGIDEDVIRAQTTVEHWSWDQTTAHGDKRTSYSQCVNGNFVSLWNYQCPNCCYQTWSNWQTKVYYDWQTWPIINTSTAFGADYRYADQRACMNGDLADYFATRPTYSGHRYADDIASGNLDTILWGCIGAHYSGNWYDGSATGGALWYLNLVRTNLAQKTWKTHWPSINWPD